MTGPGFWVKEKIYELKTTHISFVIENAEKMFSLTLDEIKSIYERCGEVIGAEQNAREEIIKKVAQSGWVRIREYLGKEGTYWSIQTNNFQLQSQRESIFYFLDYALDRKIMSAYDEIRILSFTTNEMLIYSFQEGGVSKLLEERCKF